jgi:hypothetical protein
VLFWLISIGSAIGEVKIAKLSLAIGKYRFIILGKSINLRMRQIVGLFQSPPGVENPCLIAQVLSKRTGIDANFC